MRERCFTTGEYDGECRCRFCEKERDEPHQTPPFEPLPLPVYHDDGHPHVERSEMVYNLSIGEWIWE